MFDWFRKAEQQVPIVEVSTPEPVEENDMGSLAPTVSRIVHYTDTNGVDTAAIVTKVWSDTTVNLTLFPDYHTADALRVESVSEGSGPGTWHWPELQG